MKKQVLIGTIIIICGLFIVLTNLRSFQINNKGGGEEAMKSYSASQINNLTIGSSSTNIKLIATDTDTIELSLYKSNNQSLNIAKYVSSKQKNNSLELEVSSSKRWFTLFNFGSETLEVKFPKEQLNKLTVESSSGNIKGEELVVNDKISLESRSGNIQVKHINTNEMSASVSSGNLTLQQLTVNSGEFEVRSGNIKLLDISADELEVETRSGNIEVAGDVAAIDAKSRSGNIDLDLLELKVDSSLRNSSGNIRLSLESPGSLYVTHEKSSGSTSINKSGFEMLKDLRDKVEGAFGGGDIKLKVETKSGNFRMN